MPPVLAALTLACLSEPQEVDLPALEVGVPVEGVITAESEVIVTPGLEAIGIPTYGDTYRFGVPATGTYRIELRSHLFDGVLVLRDTGGTILMEDNDGFVLFNPRIVYECDAGVEYRVSCGAVFERFGPYTLTLLEGAPEPQTKEERTLADDAEESARMTWLVREYGEPSLEVAMALQDMGSRRVYFGDYQGCVSYYERSLAMREELLDPEHRLIVLSLSQMAAAYYRLGDYARAVELMERNCASFEKLYPESHPYRLQALANLAVMYSSKGDLDSAEDTHLQVLRIRTENLGDEHPLVAKSQKDIANLYVQQGRYSEALPLFDLARSLEERLLGVDHPEFASTLNDQATAFEAVGRHAEAQANLERALEKFLELYGEHHPETAETMNNLALSCWNQGRYTEAEELHKRALAIYEDAVGPKHSLVATSLNNLAVVYEAMGRFDEAEPLYERVLEIWRESLGARHPRVALCLTNQALLKRAQGNHEEIEPLLREALDIREETLGENHAAVAQGLNALGGHLYDLGRFHEAESLHRKALAIQQELFGPEHADVALSLTNLARLLEDAGRWGEATELREGAMRSVLAYLDRELPVMPEADRMRVLAKAAGPGKLLAHVERGLISDAGLAFDLCLQWKGKATRMQVAGQTLARHESDPSVRETLGRMQQLQKDLSALVQVPAARQKDDHGERVSALQAERLSAERELRRTVDLESALRTPTWREVQAALPKGSALVDLYVAELAYAWVLKPDGEPELIALGEVVGQSIREKQEIALAAVVSRGGGAALVHERPSQGMRESLWAPLADYLQEVTTVFVSPSGFTCELPFGILQNAQDQYLLEKHRFVYLSDATRIAAQTGATPRSALDALLVGDVDYGRRGDLEGEPRLLAARRSPVAGKYVALPGTASELATLDSLFGQESRSKVRASRLVGSEASEENVRALLVGKHLVHIATHGYFEPDGALTATRLLPGLLSGLVLAGVNAEPEPGRDDGYLSAEEIQYLDLSACDLAVLSACETALGSARAGEGLMSLRRAFEVAGAKTVVSSLWKVDDRATATLMKHFYENYWLKGMGKAEALHQAKLRMLRQNRADFDGNAHPETWGAFVLSGDWR